MLARKRRKDSQLNDNQSIHVKQVLLLLASLVIIVTGSAPTLLIPDYCPPTLQLAEWHDCPFISLLSNSTPLHRLLLLCNVACACMCCWLLHLVYKRDDWINDWFDADHSHSYNSLQDILRAAHGQAAADWLLSTLTAVNLHVHSSFSAVIKIYVLNTLLSCAWLMSGGGAGFRAMFIIVQSSGYPLYTLYTGYVITRICLPPPPSPSPPLPRFLSTFLPPPEGPLAVSLLLTEFVSFNVLDPRRVAAVRARVAGVRDVAAAAERKNM
jgi:hypothetical protein